MENKNISEEEQAKINLDENDLDKVNGGGSEFSVAEILKCPGCKLSYALSRTGKEETRYVIFTYYEWKCNHCGEVFWDRSRRVDR